MINYIKRMFSWNGKASLAEWYGFKMMSVSVFIFMLVVVFPTKTIEGIYALLWLLFLFGLFAWLLIVNVLADNRVANRLSEKPYLKLLLFIPGWNLILAGMLAEIYDFKADIPNYLKPNIILAVVCMGIAIFR